MTLCPSCGNPASSTSSLCAICGATLPASQDAESTPNAAIIPPGMLTPEPASGTPFSSEVDDFLNPDDEEVTYNRSVDSPPVPDTGSPEPVIEPIPSASRPIWETLPMTDDLLFDEEILSESPSPVRTEPAFAPEAFYAESPELDGSLVPSDVPPYIPGTFSPVSSTVPKSDTVPLEFQLEDENPGLISRNTIEGSGRAEEYLSKNPYAAEDTSLAGYAGAIFSSDASTPPSDESVASTVPSRPIPPIASGSAAPTPEPSIQDEQGEMSNTDEISDDAADYIPDALPGADVPLWTKNATDLSDIPEELFFEDLEATLEDNLEKPAYKPKFSTPAPEIKKPGDDFWPSDPF